MHAFAGTIFLDQIQAREGDVKLCGLSKLQHHVLAGDFILLNFLEPLIHTDAMFHMNNVVANREVAEVRHECGRFRLAAQGLRGLDFRVVKEIACAKDHQM